VDETGQPGGVTPGINGNGRGRAADYTQYNGSWASSGDGWSNAGAALEPALESVLPGWRRPVDPLDTEQDPDQGTPPSANRQNSPNDRNGSIPAYPDLLGSSPGGAAGSPQHRTSTNAYEQIRPTYLPGLPGLAGESTSAPPYPYEGDIEDAALAAERIRPKIPSERPVSPAGGRASTAEADPAGPPTESVRHRAIEENTPARGSSLVGVPLFREAAQATGPASKPVSPAEVSSAMTGSTGQNPAYEPGYEPAQGYENPPGYEAAPEFEPRSGYEPQRYEPTPYEPPSYEPPRYESPRYAPAPSSGPPASAPVAPSASGASAAVGSAPLSTLSPMPSLPPLAEVPSQRGEPATDALPQRVPAEPDVPVVPSEPEQPGEEPAAEAPELARIWTHLRREEGPPPQQRPDGFDVSAVLDAVRGVPGVRDATLRNNPGRAHSLRLELADGADPALVSRTVTRLLGERMGLAASPRSGAAASPSGAPSGGIGRGGGADARAASPTWGSGTGTQSTLSAGSLDRSGVGGMDQPFLGGGLEQPGFDQPGFDGAPERSDRGTVRMGQSGRDEGVQGRAGAQGSGSSATGRAAPLRVPPYLAGQAEPVAAYDSGLSPPVGIGTPATLDPRAGSAATSAPRSGLYAPEVGGGYAAREPAPYTRDLGGYGDEQNVPQAVPPRPLDPGERPGPRVLIDQVLVSTYGLDATVEVRLTADGRRASGQVSGPAVDSYLLRLAAVAAGKAINQLLRGSGRQEQAQCYVEHAAVMPFGTCDVAIVVLLLSCGGWVEQLAGSALVAGDQRQAVVRATLAAVNRRLEALLA
jgi:hypothetical protein